MFVEYTRPDSAKGNVLAALEHGAHVVVGTSGLTDEDYAEIDAVARGRERGCSRWATSPSPWCWCRSSRRRRPGDLQAYGPVSSSVSVNRLPETT